MGMAELSRIFGAQVLLALPALFFLARALQSGLPSRRLANLGLACGLAALIMPEKLLQLPVLDYPALFLAIGIARVILGAGGLVLAALAISRRGDGGAGTPRLLLATVLSVLHAALGIASLVQADKAMPGAPQIYAAPDGAFQLTLPSRHWHPGQAPNSVVVFSHANPEMHARVRTSQVKQDESDFLELAQLMIERIESIPRIKGKLDMEDGQTPSGNRYRYFSGLGETPDGAAVFAAYSVVWSPRTSVLVEISFEGMPKESSDRTEMQTIEQAARTICLSVE